MREVNVMGNVDEIFKALMPALARRGGIATKKRVATDSRYYSSIGRLGGKASASARRARIAENLEGRAPRPNPIDERPTSAVAPTVSWRSVIDELDAMQKRWS